MKIYKIGQNMPNTYVELNKLCEIILSKVMGCFDSRMECEIEGIKIVLVDGDRVKLNYNMDFVEGGNDMVYNFISEKTIWIDDNLEEHDYKFIILHEFIERYLMDNYGLDYERAHRIANEYEKKFREAT